MTGAPIPNADHQIIPRFKGALALARIHLFAISSIDIVSSRGQCRLCENLLRLP